MILKKEIGIIISESNSIRKKSIFVAQSSKITNFNNLRNMLIEVITEKDN